MAHRMHTNVCLWEGQQSNFYLLFASLFRVSQLSLLSGDINLTVLHLDRESPTPPLSTSHRRGHWGLDLWESPGATTEWWWSCFTRSRPFCFYGYVFTGASFGKFSNETHSAFRNIKIPRKSFQLSVFFFKVIDQNQNWSNLTGRHNSIFVPGSLVEFSAVWHLSSAANAWQRQV